MIDKYLFRYYINHKLVAPTHEGKFTQNFLSKLSFLGQEFSLKNEVQKILIYFVRCFK